MSQSSYVSSNDSRLHFGLGPVGLVDIEVRWPLGTVEVHKNVAANQIVTLREGSSSIKAERLVPASPTTSQSH